MKLPGKPLGLRTKLLVSFIVILLIPFIGLGIFAPMVYTNSLEGQINTHTLQMIDMVNHRLDDLVADVDASMNLLMGEPFCRDFFSARHVSDEGRNLVEEGLYRFRRSRPDFVAGSALVAANGSWCADALAPVTRKSLAREPWYVQAVIHPNKIYLFSRPIGRNLRSTLDLGADDVVSLVKALPPNENGKSPGVILIDVRVIKIREVFTGLSLGSSGFLFIMDLDGSIVYSPVNPVVYRVSADWFTPPGRGVVYQWGSTAYQLHSKISDFTGWRTVGVFSLQEQSQEIQTLWFFSLGSALAALVLAFVLTLILTSSFISPILTLRSLMKQVEGGDLNVRFASRGQDEVSQLGAGFNTMINEIRNLIEQVYVVQQSKREAELHILQEQIKPHFLYNTLDTIQWMAQERGAKDIVDVINALTRLFRIGLSRGKEMISFREEVEHIQSYLFIQKIRYEDKFDYQLDIPGDLLPVQVLRLILQPLVENALYHGIKKKRGSGTIRVEAEHRGEVLLVRVIDDGAGMSPQELESLNDRLKSQSPREDESGYGIFNVNGRLRLAFGRLYGLSFSPRPGGGTVAEIRHPIMEQRKVDHALESIDR